MSIYTTLAQEAETEIEVLRSRFIASGREVISAIEAEAFLAQIRKRYPDATHHCFAFKVAGPPVVDRFSDDGEPSGTAGKPIYTVLEHHVHNAIIVVTRYFGGTKLGKGGLVKAYTEAAKALLEVAGSVEREHEIWLQLDYAYTLGGSLEHFFQSLDLKPELEYSDQIRCLLPVPESQWEQVIARFEDWVGQGLTWTLLENEKA